MQIEDPTITPTKYKRFNCLQLKTGEIGMTKEVLAGVCGVTATAIDYHIKKTKHSVVLAKKSFKGGGASIILEWDFCQKMINHYCETE